MNRPTTINPMLPAERKAVFSLASIFSLRMFGLFMLLPVLAIYTDELSGTTPLLIGVALGSYGLTQALFQIPLGLLSDRIDRKRVIAGGLVIFAVGSVVAALSDSIHGLIVGRAIQGAGAVSAAVLALNADLTRDEQRTKAMAIIGISIGFTFLLSLIVAPILQNFIGVSGLFWMISILAMVAIIVLFKVVPKTQLVNTWRENTSFRQQFAIALKSQQLIQLNFGIMVLHMVLTALFLILPTIIIDQSGLMLPQHWQLYTPVLLISIIGMAPFVIYGSKPQTITTTYKMAILLLLVSLGILLFSHTHPLLWLIVSLVLFFSAFNALESILPSLVSQIASNTSKGTALGIYNTFQFSGIFFGGVLGGLISGRYGNTGVILLCVVIVLIWLVTSGFSERFQIPGPNVAESSGTLSG